MLLYAEYYIPVSYIPLFPNLTLPYGVQNKNCRHIPVRIKEKTMIVPQTTRLQFLVVHQSFWLSVLGYMVDFPSWGMKLWCLNSCLLYSKLVSHFKYYHRSKYTHTKIRFSYRFTVTILVLLGAWTTKISNADPKVCVPIWSVYHLFTFYMKITGTITVYKHVDCK